MQKFLFSILLSLVSFQSFADLGVYNLSDCKDSVYIGAYAQKELYICSVSGIDGISGVILIHADKTTQDFTFSVEKTEVGAAKSLQIIHTYELKHVNLPFLQVLYEGLCVPKIHSPKDVQLIKKGFVFNYNAGSDCNRYFILDETADTWQWDGQLFQKTTSHTRYPTDEAFATYKQLLSEGKLVQAIEHAPESDPTGGWSNCHYDVYQELFVATHKKIKGAVVDKHR